MGPFHQVGIAFATAAAAWVNALWLGYLLWRGGHLRFEVRLKRFAFRMALTCVGTVILLKSLQALVQPLLLRGEFVRDISVAGLVSFGLVGFLILSHFMGAFRLNDFKLMFMAR